jgi:hypothetical protein
MSLATLIGSIRVHALQHVFDMHYIVFYRVAEVSCAYAGETLCCTGPRSVKQTPERLPCAKQHGIIN